MAAPFAAFLAKPDRAVARRRTVTVIAAVALHGVLLAVALVVSFAPPPARVTRAVGVSLLAAPRLPGPPPGSPAAAAPAPTPPAPAVKPRRRLLVPVAAPTTMAVAEASAPEPAGAAEGASEGTATGPGVAGGTGEGGGPVGEPAPSVTPAPPPPPKPALPDPSVVAAARARYLAALRARIASVLRVPDEAERLGVEGTVVLRIAVDAGGQVRSLRLVGDCPHDVLCEDAKATITAAGTFPPPPPELGALAQIDVPLVYRLN